MAVDPVAVDPVAVEPVAVEPVAVEPVAVDPVAVQPVTVEPAVISGAMSWTRSDLRALGLSDVRIDGLLRGGELVRDHRGVFVLRGQRVDLFREVRSALKAVGHTATVGRLTAARLHAFDGVEELAAYLEPSGKAPLDLWVPPDATIRKRAGIRALHTDLAAADVTTRFGVRVTAPARTLVDLARLAPIGLVVGLVDAALRDKHCTLVDLQTALSSVSGLRGVVGARRAVALARAGTRSLRETRLRLILVTAGFPCPVVGFLIHDGDLILAEADLAYPHLLIWIEYDGYEVHSQRETFRRDRSRQRLVERRGWFVLRAVDRDIDDPTGFLSDLRAAVAEAPRRIAALRAGLSPEADAAKAALQRRS